MNIAPQRFFKTDYTVQDENGVQSIKKMVGRRLIGQNEAGVQEFMECDSDHLLNNPEILREHAVVFMGV